MTWTRAPAWTATIAAVMPARPAPTTPTSATGIDLRLRDRPRGLVDWLECVQTERAPVDAGRDPQLLELAAPRDGAGARGALANEGDQRPLGERGGFIERIGH